MKILSYEEYVGLFINGVKQRLHIDYKDSKSVCKQNQGIKISSDATWAINCYYPDRIKDFAALLEDPIAEIRLYSAMDLIEMSQCSQAIKEKALAVIMDSISAVDPIKQFEVRVWLEQWKSTVIL